MFPFNYKRSDHPGLCEKKYYYSSTLAQHITLRFTGNRADESSSKINEPGTLRFIYDTNN